MGRLSDPLQAIVRGRLWGRPRDPLQAMRGDRQGQAMGSPAVRPRGDRQGQGLDVTGMLWDPLGAIVRGRPRGRLADP